MDLPNVGEYLEAAKRRAIGQPQRLPRRALTVALLGALAVALGGVWLAARTGLETSSSSLPYLRPVLGLATSIWTYVAVLAWLSRRILIARDQRYGEQAASVTGYEPRSVRRLAYEAKSPSESTRVIATTDDEPEEIRERVFEALETGEDDTVTLNTAALEVTPEDVFLDGDRVPADQERYEMLLGTFRSLRERADVLEADLDEGTDDLLSADVDEGSVADALSGGRDRVAFLDLLGDDEQDLADDLEETAAELEENLRLQEEILDELEQVETVLEAEAASTADEAESAGRLAWVRGRISRNSDDEDSEDVDKEGDPWREELKLFRLDLASTLDFGEVVWSFVVPGALTVAGILIVLGIWLPPLLYLPVFAAGVLVGSLNYWRVTWKRSRKLSALRQERETVNWSDVSILVKEVDLPETRVQYAWMGDHRYAHDDREEFADEIALRAYELVNEVEVSPSVMTKQAEELERYHPDLHGFRDAEKEQIMTWLLDRVESARHGLVPKAQLIEDCVEHDLESRQFAPGIKGQGYDPELVREAYRELVPAALVEQEIAVEEGADETVTAVRHRRDPLPPEYGQIRAQFTSQFDNYARWDAMYELPDVSDRLDAEPDFASTLGYRGAADD